MTHAPDPADWQKAAGKHSGRDDPTGPQMPPKWEASFRARCFSATLRPRPTKALRERWPEMYLGGGAWAAGCGFGWRPDKPE